MGNLLDCSVAVPLPSTDPPSDPPEADGPPALIVAGPSGVGKGTLIAMLMKAYPDAFAFSVSHTSRPPRKGEKDGVNYNFSDVPTMKQMIERGEFIEHAEVCGKYYGMSFESVEAVRLSGKICLLDIDLHGCRMCRAAGLRGKYLFLLAPSMEELERRLRGRGTEDTATLQRCLASAASEIDALEETGLFDHSVVNDNVEACYKQIVGLLQPTIDSLAASSAEHISSSS